MHLISVREVAAEDTRELRRTVLRPGAAAGSPLPGDHQQGVKHLAAYAGPSLASACLIFVEACPWLPGRRAWRLRGMATDPTLRGTGAGTAILNAAREIAISDGATVLWCQARETATGFYFRNGWQASGDLFDTDFGPHLRMWLDLVPTPRG